MSFLINRKRDNVVVPFDTIELIKHAKSIDVINDEININQETYILSSAHDLGSGAATANVRFDLQGNTVHLQTYIGSAWVNSGTSWQVVGN